MLRASQIISIKSPTRVIESDSSDSESLPDQDKDRARKKSKTNQERKESTEQSYFADYYDLKRPGREGRRVDLNDPKRFGR